MSGHETLIELVNAGVRYKKFLNIRHPEYTEALRDVTFSVYSGETLGVIGRNGAGKSTLLRLLADIIKPDSGVVRRKTRSVAMLSLGVSMMPHLSGRENAIISGIMMGMRRRAIESSIDEITEFSELGERIDDPVRTYSSGMKARLGFAVAKQADPDVLLIDEVLSVGDAGFREKSREAILERIHSDRTVILVSHSDLIIDGYCDRAVWIEDGTVQSTGKPEVVLNEYLSYLPPPRKAVNHE